MKRVREYDEVCGEKEYVHASEECSSPPKNKALKEYVVQNEDGKHVCADHNGCDSHSDDNTDDTKIGFYNFSYPSKKLSLEERLAQGMVLCGEGYLFELERRGYVQVGSFVPEVLLENPEVVEQLHREFLRAGSDVIEAFTYYGHREKMRLIGKEHLIEQLNRKALEIAKKVAAEGNALFAGNLSNTNVYNPEDPASIEQTRKMFEEQVTWAKEAGVDFVIAETFDFLGEALLAVETIRKAGLPAVVTLALSRLMIREPNISLVEAGRRLYEAGASVVGLNCTRGPATMLPLLKELCDNLPCPIAALPVPFHTCEEHPTFQSLQRSERMYTELECHTLSRYEMAEFAREAAAIGVKYLGVCCGGAPYHVRAMAEALGRKPPASKYSPDLSLHFVFGTHKSLRDIHTKNKHLL